MIWNKLLGKTNKKDIEIRVFELSVVLSFRTVAQVSYKDENGNTKISRFFSDNWTKEVLSFVGNVQELRFKVFVHTPNLRKKESVKLSVSTGGETLISQTFTIDKGNDFAGWFELK